MALIDGAGAIGRLIAAIVGFVSAAVYFSRLDRFTDSVMIWLAVLPGMPIHWVARPSQRLVPAARNRSTAYRDP